ncbi:putative lipoprotein with Yx(FWY)xxD motif [Prauserella shujinwangii]|uniref:Putative lipoprotein with Yx(FWY)xxD motif n=1 Tax=Prauserella shujinwangii TaxID=1453103 RepID=A0A2T0M3L3_9PSEU|nr:hypothetical protein [Prauserella shujinwangii]PRX51299.1 putative lipoprotein with Yx(FWY)xxD motif [Prauserella shujinwangii]
MSRKGIAVPVGAVAGLALLTACGYGTGGAGTPSPAAVQQQAQPSGQAEGNGQVELVAAEVGDLGEVLTDQNGRTLYRFANDSADLPASVCEADCATAWPPLLADGAVRVEGVDQNLVGKLTRSDGTEQVTVSGWPVYRYAKDTAPGQANGQGVGGTWAAVTPDGGEAGETAVRTTDIGGLGTVLTDQNGRTLYLFTEDGSKPPKATCDGDCAEKWPPLLAEGEVELSGVDPAIVGEVRRSDGTEQVTVGGWPVYRYAEDTVPGQAAGHGVGDVWYAVEPDGCKVSPDKKPTGRAAGEAGADGSGEYDSSNY